MAYKSKFAHTDPLFCKSSLLKLLDIISLHTYLFVFKFLHEIATNCGFQLMYNNFNARRPKDLMIPLCRTTHAQQSVIVMGTRLWNQLPEQLKNMVSLVIFKKSVKQLLFKNYVES